MRRVWREWAASYMAKAQKMMMTGLKVKMLAMPTARQIIMARMPILYEENHVSRSQK